MHIFQIKVVVLFFKKISYPVNVSHLNHFLVNVFAPRFIVTAPKTRIKSDLPLTDTNHLWVLAKLAEENWQKLKISAFYPLFISQQY